ncbi:MAG: putative dTDP-4-dehydrorhamnose reductase, partial [Actinomycetota bacterium]
MKYLVLGSSGFLGSYLGFALERAGHEVVGVSRSGSPHYKTSVTASLGEIPSAIARQAPDVVINAIARASHEACEERPREAIETNATLPGAWAYATAESGAKFVHISTDAVFDGIRDGLYREDDQASPESLYGATKREGEILVLERNPGALVLRVNFFGWSKDSSKGILDFFVRSLNAGEKITGFTDYIVSSLYVGDLVDALVDLVNQKEAGVFHTVSSSPASKYEFGLMVAEELGLSTEFLKPGLLSEATELAPRGHNLALSVEKICSTLDRAMPSTLEG